MLISLLLLSVAVLCVCLFVHILILLGVCAALFVCLPKRFIVVTMCFYRTHFLLILSINI